MVNGQRWGATCAVLALIFIMGGAIAEGTATLKFHILPSAGDEQVTVELQAPDGSTQVTESSEDAFVVQPEAGPGTYRVTITKGGETAVADIVVPEHGQVEVRFQTDAAGEKISVTQPGPIENIMVTARRVEEPLQRVPVSITALTEQDIDNQHITNIAKLSLATPNLWLEKNTSSSSGARAAIRGIGEDESFFTSDTPVGIYVDDIYIPRQIGAMFDLYEVERVEVLRGPQGTLYGRNTTAGAIKLITRQPGETFALNLEAAVGNYGRTDFRGSVGVPVSDSFSFQLAGMYRQHDGYDKNLFNGDDVNDQDIWGARASLRFQPSDSVDILIVGDVLVERSTPGYALGLIPQPPYVGFYGVGLPNFDHQIDGDTDPHTLESDLVDPLNELDQQGAYAKITWQASEQSTFTSITAWRKQDWLFLTDGDGQVGNPFIPGPGGLLPLFHIFQDQKQQQYSQEFQLRGLIGDSVDYIAGVYLFHEENEQITELAILSPVGFNKFTDTSLDTDSYAAYASFNIRLAQNLTLTAGGRFTDDKKDFDIALFNPDGTLRYACVASDGTVVSETPCDENSPPGSVTTPVEKNIKESWSRFTPRLALSWAATDTILGYIDLSTGFKSGAFDGRANTAANILPLEAIPPEDVRTVEIGMKADFFNRSWRLNIGAFFTDFDDLQGTGTDPNGNFIRFSVGDVQTSGGELETIWVPVDGLQLSGNLALLSTKFTEQNFDQSVDCAPLGTPFKELELKYSPKSSYRLGAMYTTPNTLAGGHWSFGANYSHKDQHYLGFCNSGAQTNVGYDLVDAIIAYDTANGRWRLALTGDNLTDEEYINGLFAIASINLLTTYISPPRTYSFTVKFRF